MERMKSTIYGNAIRKQPYQKHGTETLRKTVGELAARGEHVVDESTNVGKALAEWRADLVTDLGGPDEVTTAQRAIIDVASRTKLILDSVDAWILEQPYLVNKRNRTIIGAVVQRQKIATSLCAQLGMLGLKRAAKDYFTEADTLFGVGKK